MIKLLILILFIFTASPSGAGSVYRSVDAQGNVTYSPHPPPDAVDSTTVNIPEETEAASRAPAGDDLKALVERSDELVQRRLQRNLELAKERNKLQQTVEQRKAQEALLAREMEQRRGYPLYGWSRYRYEPPRWGPRPPGHYYPAPHHGKFVPNIGNRSRLTW